MRRRIATIPNPESQSVIRQDPQTPTRIGCARRNWGLEPQLVGRGKDEQGCSTLVMPADPHAGKRASRPPRPFPDTADPYKSLKTKWKAGEEINLFPVP